MLSHRRRGGPNPGHFALPGRQFAIAIVSSPLTDNRADIGVGSAPGCCVSRSVSCGCSMIERTPSAGIGGAPARASAANSSWRRAGDGSSR